MEGEHESPEGERCAPDSSVAGVVHLLAWLHLEGIREYLVAQTPVLAEGGSSFKRRKCRPEAIELHRGLLV